MTMEALSWRIAVITQECDDDSEYSDLKNSLLYADHVDWLALDTFIQVFWTSWRASRRDRRRNTRHQRDTPNLFKRFNTTG
jgi:hypothetical protein